MNVFLFQLHNTQALITFTLALKIRRKISFNSTPDVYISTIQLVTKGVRKEEKGIQQSNDIIIHLTFNHTEKKKLRRIPNLPTYEYIVIIMTKKSQSFHLEAQFHITDVYYTIPTQFVMQTPSIKTRLYFYVHEKRL